MAMLSCKISLNLWILLAKIIILGTSCCNAAPEAIATYHLSPKVDTLMNDYWDWRISSRPELASYLGIHDYDHLLDDLSIDEFQSRYNKALSFYEQAQTIEATVTGPVDALNLKALKNELKTFLDGFKFHGHLTPISYLEGFHLGFDYLVSYMSFEKLNDYQKLFSRLHALPKQIKQIENLMREGVAKGIVQHNISMKGIPEKLAKYVVNNGEDSPLWKHFSNITVSDATPEGIADIQHTAKKILVEEIAPALKTFKDFVENEYLPHTRPEIGISTLKDGPERYQALIKYHTSTNLTAQEIYDRGLSEVDRITNEMAKIVKELGYDLSVSEFSESLRNDKNNLFENAADCMAAYRKIVNEDIYPKLLDIFLDIPKTVLEVVEDSSPDGVGAYYIGASLDGSRPGKYYVNTYYLEAQPKYNMMSLSLHEAYPGHHHQISYEIEDQTLPKFRRISDEKCYCYAPSILPTNTAYIEGWGLYSEALGFDLDLYKDPLVRYGHFSMEIFRAGRLVVDTGLHAFGWSRQKALNYMIEHTAESKADLENEIDRYITWPGQAVAYKVGQMKIQELRKTATAALGASFDLKHFHDIVFKSVGPLEILEDEVKRWIANGGKRA